MGAIVNIMRSRALCMVDIGFWINYRDSTIALTRVLIWDPCPAGLPEMLNEAHMGVVLKCDSR